MERPRLNSREEILKAADVLFGELGFDAATTREIARVSGTNKALIYYHFKNKEDLFGSVLDRYYENLAKTLQKAVGDGGSLADRMARLIDAYVDFLDGNRNFSRIVQREASGGRHMDRIRGHMAPLFRMGMELTKEAYPATRSGDLAAAQLLISFYGMAVSYFTYSGLLEHLMGTDPMSGRNLRARKRHLGRMLDIVMEAAEGQGPRGKKGKGRGPG
jgi:AcrR family transcriptional regulator